MYDLLFEVIKDNTVDVSTNLDINSVLNSRISFIIRNLYGKQTIDIHMLFHFLKIPKAEKSIKKSKIKRK